MAQATTSVFDREEAPDSPREQTDFRNRSDLVRRLRDTARARLSDHSAPSAPATTEGSSGHSTTRSQDLAGDSETWTHLLRSSLPEGSDLLASPAGVQGLTLERSRERRLAWATPTEQYSVTHWWRGTVAEIRGDDVVCELVDDRGTRSSAVLPREEFQAEDPSYPVFGQRFVLAFLSRRVRGLAERKQSLTIDPPPRAPAMTESELQAEVTRIFGGRGDDDGL